MSLYLFMARIRLNFLHLKSLNLNISVRMSCSTCISDILKDINYVLSFRWGWISKNDQTNANCTPSLIISKATLISFNRNFEPNTPRKNQKPHETCKLFKGKSSLILLKSCFLSIWFLSWLRVWNDEYKKTYIHLS